MSLQCGMTPEREAQAHAALDAERKLPPQPFALPMPNGDQRAIQAVAKRYGIRLEDLKCGKGRYFEHARQLAMFLIYEQGRSSLPKLGRLFGGKHHTTVVKGIQHVKAAMESDERVAALVAELRAEIAEERPAKVRAFELPVEQPA